MVPAGCVLILTFLVVCRKMDVYTIRQHARIRELIEAIPEEDWTRRPLLDGRRRRRPRPPTLPSRARSRPSAAHRPAGEAHARVPTGTLRQLQLSRLLTDRDGETLELEADHRRHAEIENAIRRRRPHSGAASVQVLEPITWPAGPRAFWTRGW